MSIGGTPSNRVSPQPPRTDTDRAQDAGQPDSTRGPARSGAGTGTDTTTRPAAPGDSFATVGGSPSGPAPTGPGAPRPQAAQGTAAAAQADGASDAELQRKLAAGELAVTDFQGLKRGQAADAVAKLATGNLDQRDNLVRLMADPSFAGHLGTALNEMQPADRTRVLKSVGESTGAQAPQVQGTLALALDGMVPSRRDETLRESLLSRDSAALSAANGYLTAKPEAAGGFLRSVTSDSTVDDAKLARVFEGLTGASQSNGLKALASGPAGDAREVFKRLGDAVYDSKQDPTRNRLEQALDSMPTAQRNELLKKVIGDPAGNQRTDQQVNKGQKLVAEYIDRKGPAGVQQFLGSVPAADRPAFESFIKQNVRNEDVQRALNQPAGSVNSGEVRTADERANTLIDTVWKGAIFQGRYLDSIKKLNGPELDAHLGKLGAADAGKLLNVMSPGAFGTDYTDGNRLAIIDHVVQNGGPASKAKLAAGLANSFQNDRPWWDSDKGQVREQMGQLLKSDANGAIREMDPSDLKNVVKSYMHPPADMSQLKSVLGDLTPQSAAKLAKAVQMAAPEVAAETKAGTWAGDVLKGLTISGKAGRSSSVKVGDAKATGGEATTGMSAEIGFSWSPAALVEGGRTREANQVTSELNSFMSDWTAQLNRMSPNQKAILLDEMKDSVTLRMN